MTLISVERMKLFSTRSPYWCLASILAAALLFALLMGLVNDGDTQPASPFTSQIGLQLGMMVFMVMAVLAVTTEYRFNTIKTSFLATPKRGKVLLAKTATIILVGAVTAVVCSLAAFYLTKVLSSNPSRPLEFQTGEDWRVVFGHTAVFPIAGVIAIAVGVLIRQSAGAITLLLVWSMLIESLVQLIPNVGPDIQPWLPFTAAQTFVTATSDNIFGDFAQSGPTPVQGVLVFAATAVVLWFIALAVLNKRDA